MEDVLVLLEVVREQRHVVPCPPQRAQRGQVAAVELAHEESLRALVRHEDGLELGRDHERAAAQLCKAVDDEMTS